MDNKFDSPCTKECPDRRVYPNCHMTCERYLDFRSYLDKKNKDKHSELKEYLNDNDKTKVMY